MSLSNDLSSIPGLLGTAVEQLGKLVRNEVRLARAEIADKISQAGMGVAYVAVAGALMVPAFVMVLIALALWITQLGVSNVGAYLIAAAVGAVVSGVLAMAGLNRLKPDRLMPKVTIEQVEQDVTAARELAK